jgi:hypothetical protein
VGIDADRTVDDNEVVIGGAGAERNSAEGKGVRYPFWAHVEQVAAFLTFFDQGLYPLLAKVEAWNPC